MTAAEGTRSEGANATTPSEPESPIFSNPFTAASGNVVAAWPDYMIDALQRSVLFLDLLRRRGNEEIEITSRPMATVLSFGHDVLIDGRSLPRALGIDQPKVAVLAAVETVRTKMPATLDGAILAKMADRRQIVGGIVDGPLDLDAAVDAEAARIKHITSPVAGLADILIVPNIEAGNMVYKNLAFMADAQTAGLVVGARVPVILTSRADTAAARRFSAAAAVLYADALARDPAILLPETAE